MDFLGFFNLMLGRSKEAVKLFQQSQQGSTNANPSFQKELLYNLATAHMKENDVAAAEKAFKAAAGAAEAMNDFRKLASAHQQLGLIAGKRGDKEVARHELNAALDLLADYSADPTTIQVNAFGLHNTGKPSLATTYQDLFSNQTFDNSSGGWGYSHQIIQSLQDINF